MTFAQRIPARFGRVFEFDPAAPPPTAGHAAEVRRALSYRIGHVEDRLNMRLAQAYKRTGRRAITVSFTPAGSIPYAHAGLYFINISASVAPAALYDLARHEYLHVVEINLFTAIDDELIRALHPAPTWAMTRELFAEAGREWLDSDGAFWPALTAVLLP